MIHLFQNNEKTACGLAIEIGTLDTYTVRTKEPVTREPGATNCCDCMETRDTDNAA